MAWSVMDTPAPFVRLYKTGGRLGWNEATHRLFGCPGYVDLVLDAEAGLLALRGGSQYVVGVTDDEARYRIYAGDALTAAGVSLDANYTTTPRLVDDTEGEVPGLVGAIEFDLPS